MMTPEHGATLQTIHARTAPAIARHIDDGTLVIDLTVYGWRPHFAAQQVAAQAGWTLEDFLADRPPILLPDTRNAPLTGAHIGSWIDFELFGDAVRILSERICQRAPETFQSALILLPETAGGLSPTDAVFLRLFIPAMIASGRPVTLSYPDAEWPLDLSLESAELPFTGPCGDVPAGVLEPGIAERLPFLGIDASNVISLSGGRVLVSPERRLAARPLSDRALVIMPSWGWATNAQLLDLLPATELSSRAWQALQAMDDTLALALGQHGMMRFPDDAQCALTFQTIAIIVQKYDSLAGTSFSSDRRTHLGQAWGLTMSGATSDALEILAPEVRAGRSVFDLLLANIAALAHFRAGDTGSAQALLEWIAQAMAEEPKLGSPHLTFLNKLNRARLHRAKVEFEPARQLIIEAFDARAPMLSEFDGFYRELLLEDIAARHGETATATAHLEKAIASLRAMRHPSAMPRRTARFALKGEEVSPDQFAGALDALLSERLSAIDAQRAEP